MTKDRIFQIISQEFAQPCLGTALWIDRAAQRIAAEIEKNHDG